MEQQGRFQDLLHQVNAGSDEAVRLLVMEYGDHILRVVRQRLNSRLRSKFDSADFVQSVWASFFAIPKGELRFERAERAVSFLVQIAHNKVVDAVRQRLQTQKYNVRLERPLHRDDPLHAIGHASRTPTPSEVAIAREEWQLLRERTPPHHLPILNARLQGHDLQTIAESLGIHPRTVRRILDQIEPRDDRESNDPASAEATSTVPPV